MRKAFFILLYTGLVAVSVACEKVEDVSQECVGATILGTTCEGATLLQLDTAVPIGGTVYFSGDMGAPTPGLPAVEGTYANVVKTFTHLPTLQRGGPQWFFKLRAASSEEMIERFCTANKMWYDAPQVIVTDSSFASCKSFSVK